MKQVDMERFIDAVESLAFSIPAPNPWTPQLVGLAAQARTMLYELAAMPHEPPNEAALTRTAK